MQVNETADKLHSSEDALFSVYGSRIVAEMYREVNRIEDIIFSLMYHIPFTLCQCTFYIPKSKFPYYDITVTRTVQCFERQGLWTSQSPQSNSFYFVPGHYTKQKKPYIQRVNLPHYINRYAFMLRPIK